MDIGWTTGFFEAMQGGHRSPVDGFSPHFYTDFRNHPMRVAEFSPSDWYAVLLEGLRTETVIETHWKAMGTYDPDRRTKLVIDEWGVWYKPGEEITPAYILSQPVTLRDALHTAITFDIFNRHADKIAMANVAQTINCIHSLFLALEDKYTRTPPYYVFEMYRPHMGARHVPMRVRADELTVPIQQGTAKMPALTGSASVRQNRLTITLTNPSLDAPLATRLRLTRRRRAVEARGTVLTHSDMRARNTFENPNEVRPASLAVDVSGDTAGSCCQGTPLPPWSCNWPDGPAHHSTTSSETACRGSVNASVARPSATSTLDGPERLASSLAFSSCAYCSGEGLSGDPIRCQTV